MMEDVEEITLSIDDVYDLVDNLKKICSSQKKFHGTRAKSCRICREN